MRRFCFFALSVAVAVVLPVGLTAGQNAPPSPFSPELIQVFTPADNPVTDAKAELGDKRLSVDACNTGPSPRTGFTARIETAKGVRDQLGKRNARRPGDLSPCTLTASS